MTNEDRLKDEVENYQYRLLGLMADEALDRGEPALQAGYLWLRDNGKWPYRSEGWWRMDRGRADPNYSFSIDGKYYISGHQSKNVYHYLRILANHIGEIILKEEKS